MKFVTGWISGNVAYSKKLGTIWPSFTAVESGQTAMLWSLRSVGLDFGFRYDSGLLQTCGRLSCRQATNANPLDKILHGSVGYLTPRSGGTFD